MNDSSTNYILEFDSQKQIFRLSAPVFQGSADLPKSVARFFANHFQQGSAISLEKNKIVMIREEIPFSRGPQTTMREQFYRFARRARRCRHLFGRLAQIEHRDNADALSY